MNDEAEVVIGDFETISVPPRDFDALRIDRTLRVYQEGSPFDMMLVSKAYWPVPGIGVVQSYSQNDGIVPLLNTNLDAVPEPSETVLAVAACTST